MLDGYGSRPTHLWRLVTTTLLRIAHCLPHVARLLPGSDYVAVVGGITFGPVIGDIVGTLIWLERYPGWLRNTTVEPHNTLITFDYGDWTHCVYHVVVRWRLRSFTGTLLYCIGRRLLI